VSFATEDEGWACGRWGTILHTSDGGRTWARQRSGTDFTLASVQFVDDKTGWAVGNEGTILHTSDSGQAWTPQKSPVDSLHMGVRFINPLEGWIVSENETILHTKEGGKNWTVQYQGLDYRLKAVSFADPLHGWAVGEYGFTYGTRDGGKKWALLGGYLRVNEETFDLEGGDFLFDVLAVNSDTAWATGIDGQVSRTTDGGKTWEDMDTGAPETQLFCIASDGSETLVIGGKGVVLCSQDGGSTWAAPRFEPHVDHTWIYDVAHRGDSLFVAVGEDGVIYRNDEQNVWTRVNY